MSETLYVLKLQGGKYYVGKSVDVKQRFKQHLSGRGSAWTNMYKPVSIIETRPINSSFDETNVTKEYMKKYGIENVRGGAYSMVNLPRSHSEAVQTEFRAAGDNCFKCGKSGHFARNCNSRLEQHSDYEEDDDDLYEDDTPRVGTCCYRCGRPGHYSPDCYASRHVKGYSLDD